MKNSIIRKLAALTAAAYACTMMPVTVSFADMELPEIPFAASTEYEDDIDSDNEEIFSVDESVTELVSEAESETDSSEDPQSSVEQSEDESSVDESSEDESSVDESSEDESSVDESSEDESSQDESERDIAEADISIDDANCVYTGEEIRPEITVTYNDEELAEGEDYELEFSNNTNAGKTAVTITGIGDYTGSAERTFNIAKANVSDLSVSLSATAFSYTGKVITPLPTVKFNGRTLTKDADYTVNYSGNLNVGSASVVITGSGNFTGSRTLNFAISQADISSLKPTLSYTTCLYVAKDRTPVPTLTFNGTKLVKDTDYTVKYTNNLNVGTATVTLTGKGKFKGTTKATFTITKYDLSKLAVTLPAASYMYNGKGLVPAPKLSLSGKTLVKGTDYNVTYTNNINVGTATVKVTGKGNFQGTSSKTFKITARPLSAVTVNKIADVRYNGLARTPSPVVKYGTVTFTKGTDYTVAYTNNINTGTATVTITGKNRLSGTKKITFKIIPFNVVTDYGAKANDTVDDYYAFYKALVYARETMPSNQKLEVYVPAGTYHISHAIGIYSNTRFILDPKAVLINDTPDSVLITIMGMNGQADGYTGYNQAHDIYIEGGTFNGNGSSKKTESKAIMIFRNCKNLTIKNTTVTKVYGNHFIICDGVSGLTVTGTKFTDFVAFAGSKSNYEFTKYFSDPGDQKNAINAVEALHIDFANDGTPCANVTVTGCTFNNVPSGIGTHHINSKYATNINIYNNTFTNVWFSCVHASSFKSTKVYNNTATNTAILFRAEDTEAEVYNNTLSGLSSVPSSRYDTTSIIYTVLIQDGSKVNFHDNTLKNVNGTAAMFKNNGSKVNTFKNNTINGAARDGMFIENTIMTVTYNTIKNCKVDGVKALGSQVTCTNNNIVSCGDKYANFFRACTKSTCKDNGITSGEGSTFARDSSVSTGSNYQTISSMTVTIPATSYAYTGSAIKPAVTVKNGSSVFSSSNYTVTYSNNVKIGIATITIEGKGSWRGFIKKTFVIRPKAQTLTLSSTSANFKAVWTRNLNVSGYQIQYTKDSTFKTGITTYTVTRNTIYTHTFTGSFKTGELWYVRYRPYYTVGSSKYGDFCAVKKVRIK